MWRDFSRRSGEKEIMDAGIADFHVFDESLREIEAVNRLTLGYRPVLRWLAARFAALRNQKVSVLDIGFGRGGLLRSIWRLAKHYDVDITLSGLDIAPWSAGAARGATPSGMNIDYHVDDVFRSDISADFAVCSHITHHMTDDEIIALIGWLEARARKGWIIADLQRSSVAYFFSKLVLFLMPVNDMVRNDGAVSVARSLTRNEWKKILHRAGVEADILWHFPFRFSISRLK